MKITMIRHGEVNMKWQKCYNANSFDADCARYDAAPILLISKDLLEVTDCPIYISELERTHETAVALFGEKDFIVTSLLNEVPLSSFCASNHRLPLWMWNVVGRLQWLFNNGHQLESKVGTYKRADVLIIELESKQEDCILVTHGFFMRSLIKRLKKHGYTIEKSNRAGFSNRTGITNRSGISNLDHIVAIK